MLAVAFTFQACAGNITDAADRRIAVQLLEGASGRVGRVLLHCRCDSDGLGRLQLAQRLHPCKREVPGCESAGLVEHHMRATRQGFQRVLAVNVTGAFICARELRRSFAE